MTEMKNRCTTERQAFCYIHEFVQKNMSEPRSTSYMHMFLVHALNWANQRCFGSIGVVSPGSIGSSNHHPDKNSRRKISFSELTAESRLEWDANKICTGCADCLQRCGFYPALGQFVYPIGSVWCRKNKPISTCRMLFSNVAGENLDGCPTWNPATYTRDGVSIFPSPGQVARLLLLVIERPQFPTNSGW